MTKTQIFMLFFGSFGMGITTMCAILQYNKEKLQKHSWNFWSLPKVDCKFPLPKVSKPRDFKGNGMEMVE